MAQFTKIPPLETIAIFFKEVTGLDLAQDVAWTSWVSSDTSGSLEVLKGFYRPCHLKILNDTEAGLHMNPCALLRQLLRPHNLNIEYRNKTWKIIRSTTTILVEDVLTQVDWS
jgi:hypothetical protein